MKIYILTVDVPPLEDEFIGELVYNAICYDNYIPVVSASKKVVKARRKILREAHPQNTYEILEVEV